MLSRCFSISTKKTPIVLLEINNMYISIKENKIIIKITPIILLELLELLSYNNSTTLNVVIQLKIRIKTIELGVL